jgi:predicted transposase YbfD/YdcC
LAEEAIDQKSNETRVIPILLESLAIRGNTTNIDAAEYQKEIIKKIREKGDHYAL